MNFQTIDTDTDWYKNELHAYRSMDPWGASVSVGWGMGTLGARMGDTQRTMTTASPSFPEFRNIIVHQMKKLAEIGADGVHIDKLLCINRLDFNTNLKAAPDKAYLEGILKGIDEQ